MGDVKGRPVRRRTPIREAEVKPGGPGAEADSPAGQSHEGNGLGGLTVLGTLWFIAGFFAR
jgi:hypothetical protein